MQKITGWGLNIWNDASREEPDNWKMAVYPDYNGHTDTATYLTLEATPERVTRYLETWDDDDWWVYDKHPDFRYILWGERV